MSNPETVVHTLLSEGAGFTALVGAKFYDTRAPAGTLPPYAVFMVVTDPADLHMDGASAIRRTVVQVDCFGADTAQARAVADAAHDALEMRPSQRRPVAGLNVRQMARTDARTLDDGEATGLFRRSADYTLTWMEE